LKTSKTGKCSDIVDATRLALRGGNQSSHGKAPISKLEVLNVKRDNASVGGGGADISLLNRSSGLLICDRH
jgi:hypothetical protein